ncbi:hypothetical protein HGM15179_004294 [Zosterops borbonicus]|uniref:Uncharacterized protein n=1 Tax=Zosterops borbonicus TaxID=364589 RepID=A0A8K1GRF3_9PASS|nr:hypothetical protein HGM15179_004294 [Zosterops borbonicus]
MALREGGQHPRVTLGSKGWLRITLLTVAREQPGCSDAELSAHPLELEMPLLPRPDEGQRGSQNPEVVDHDCENDHLSVDSEIVQDLLPQLDPYKSMGPDGINPRSLNEVLM